MQDAAISNNIRSGSQSIQGCGDSHAAGDRRHLEICLGRNRQAACVSTLPKEDKAPSEKHPRYQSQENVMEANRRRYISGWRLCRLRLLGGARDARAKRATIHGASDAGSKENANSGVQDSGAALKGKDSAGVAYSHMASQ